MATKHSGSRAKLLAEYDAQLRTESETPSAVAVTQLGTLRLVTFAGGRGFITYRDLGGLTIKDMGTAVRDALLHFQNDPDITRVEWKTRAHDRAPGLHEALIDSRFVPGEPESIMVGKAEALAVKVPLPAGVTLRQIVEEDDVRAMSAMQDEVFGDPISRAMADALLNRLNRQC